jgi:ribosomal protein L11 methyltransferase
VLAIAAAKTGTPIAVGTDIDEPSARIANENAEINDANCDFYFADGLSDPRIAQHAPYDLVFANILAAPLVELAPEIGAALATGGVAILSGLLRTQEERVLEAYLPLGFVVEQTIHHDAWSALQLRKG